MYGSNGAYACDTSSGLYQEISQTSVTLKKPNLAQLEQACRADKQEGQQKQAIDIRRSENSAHASPRDEALQIDWQ